MKQFADRLKKASEASARVKNLVQAEAELKSQLVNEARSLQNKFTSLQNELERIMHEEES